MACGTALKGPEKTKQINFKLKARPKLNFPVNCNRNMEICCWARLCFVCLSVSSRAGSFHSFFWHTLERFDPTSGIKKVREREK